MKAWLLGLFVAIVLFVVFNFLSGAFNVQGSITLSYNNIHHQIEIASDNSK